MSKKEKGGFFDESRPNIQLDQLPIRYTVPFDWGRLRVTDAAHQAYGLVPLTPNFVKGDVDTAANTDNKSHPLPRTSILLIGPQEIHKEDSPVNPFGVQSGIRFDKNGLDMFLGMTQDKDGMSQAGEMLMSQVAEILGIDQDELVHDLTDDNGVPFGEAFSHSMPQAIAHIIPSVVGGILKETNTNWMHSESDTKLVKGVTRAGLISVGATVLMLSPEIETSEPITPFRASIAAGFLLSTLILNRSYIKKSLELRRDSEDMVSILSEAHAAQVAEDIHLTYCAQHFDDQNEELFED